MPLYEAAVDRRCSGESVEIAQMSASSARSAQARDLRAPCVRDYFSVTAERRTNPDSVARISKIMSPNFASIS